MQTDSTLCEGQGIWGGVCSDHRCTASAFWFWVFAPYCFHIFTLSVLSHEGLALCCQTRPETQSSSLPADLPCLLTCALIIASINHRTIKRGGPAPSPEPYIELIQKACTKRPPPDAVLACGPEKNTSHCIVCCQPTMPADWVSRNYHRVAWGCPSCRQQP